MKKIFLLLAAAVLLGTQVNAKKIRVACVGNSITYGAFIPDRDKWSYPAQLQAYLGDEYEVRNFGVNGATLLHQGDNPYIKTNEYKQSQDFLPDIVLIKLGTNDSKSQNWQYKDEFLKDYQAFIDAFRGLNSHPRIILLTPLRCFTPENDPINSKIIAKEVRPLVEEMAYRNGLEIINMHSVMTDTWIPDLRPDHLHPSAKGAGMMALKIYKHLTIDAESATAANSAKPFYKQGAKTFNFHGFTGYEFKNEEGVTCRVVEPRVAAKGRPWLWRARFWDFEPQTDIDLLERGYHVAYCDVAELFGSPRAVARWDAFYKQMIKAGFSRKMALEGMSRGGLIVYNWAAKNADKVACIYADAPVMDIKQWPMISGSADEKQRMLDAYGFANDDEARAWQGNPINHARAISKGHFPILHLVGDSDEGVTYRNNTKIFEEQMRALGTPIQVYHKPATGHHPHSLACPQPIVDFILHSMNQ